MKITWKRFQAVICDSAQAITFCLVFVVSPEDISLVRSRPNNSHDKCSRIIKFQRRHTSIRCVMFH
jgi:hypothetical protein